MGNALPSHACSMYIKSRSDYSAVYVGDSNDSSNEENQRHAYELGGSDFHTKPLSADNCQACTQTDKQMHDICIQHDLSMIEVRDVNIQTDKQMHDICIQYDPAMTEVSDVNIQTEKQQLDMCIQCDPAMTNRGDISMYDKHYQLDENIINDVSTQPQGVGFAGEANCGIHALTNSRLKETAVKTIVTQDVGLAGATNCGIHAQTDSSSEDTAVKTIEDCSRSENPSTSGAEGSLPRHVPNNSTALTEAEFNQEAQATGTSDPGSSIPNSININRMANSNMYFQTGVTYNINKQTNCEEQIVWLQWAEKQMDKKEKWVEKEIAKTEKEKREIQEKYYHLQNKMLEQQQNLVTERQEAMETEIHRLREQTAAHPQSSQIPHENVERRQVFRPFSISVQGENIIPNTAAISSIAETLYQTHQVRLLGLEGGSTFILDTPEVQFSEIIRRQAEIQAILATLLPQRSPGGVVWASPTQVDIDLHVERLNEARARTDTFEDSEPQAPSTKTTAHDRDADGEQRLPGQISIFDPLTVTPKEDVAIETRWQQDQLIPFITCLVNSRSAEELYMADYHKYIKVCSLKSGHVISTLSLDVNPLTMTLVNDNLLAVTTTERFILFIEVSNSKTRVQKKIATARAYCGITVDRSRSDDPMLVVSCSKNIEGPASVDIITLTGKHVRTFVSTRTLPGLKGLEYLHADTQRDMLYISDHDSNCVFCVQLSTGQLLSELKHPKLSVPRQVCTDSAGNMYVASSAGQCVLVRSVGGEWRVLVTSREHGKGNDDGLSCISVTNTALIVGWCSGSVKRYLLSS